MARKGDRIGPYTLIEKLGRGGFGVVWLGEKRTALAATRVALKLSNDDDVDLEVIQREASVWIEASGHPNVLPIIDADIYDEQVVIVSEYAPHGSLERWLKNHGGKAPTVAKAVEMADGILAGLAHLHGKRIIHRDLKPANILLSEETPRLVDFGLARVLKTSSHSHTVSGTYAYMPPETFDGHRSEQTDLWSAGVILYELLAGRLPYPQDSDASLISAILNKLPEPLPEGLNERLSAVVMRALRKDLNERFKTAAEMRAALRQAYATGALTQDLVQTRDLGLVQDRIPTQVLELSPAEDATPHATNPMAPGITESPLGVAATKPLQPAVEQDERPTAPAPTVSSGRHRPDVTSAATTVSGERPSGEALAATPVDQPSVGPMPSFARVPASDHARGRLPNLLIIGAVLVVLIGGAILAIWYFGTGPSGTQTAANSAGNAGGAPKLTDKGQAIDPTGKALGTLVTESSVYEVAISPDGALAASAGNDNSVRLWRINESNLPVVLSGHTKTVRTVAISPDGQIVASAGDDQSIRLWRASDGGFIRALNGHTGFVFKVTFSADGQTLASAGGDHSVRLWRVSDGALQTTLNLPDPSELIVTLSPDLGRVVLFNPATKGTRVWSITGNGLAAALRGDKFAVSGGAFSPDGVTLAIGSTDGPVRVFTAADGTPLRTVTGRAGRTGSVAFDASGQLIAAGYADGSICLWRVADGQLLRTLTGHVKFVLALDFSADDRVLASGGEDKTLRLWAIKAK